MYHDCSLPHAKTWFKFMLWPTSHAPCLLAIFLHLRHLRYVPTYGLGSLLVECDENDCEGREEERCCLEAALSVARRFGRRDSNADDHDPQLQQLLFPSTSLSLFQSVIGHVTLDLTRIDCRRPHAGRLTALGLFLSLRLVQNHHLYWPCRIACVNEVSPKQVQHLPGPVVCKSNVFRVFSFREPSRSSALSLRLLSLAKAARVPGKWRRLRLGSTRMESALLGTDLRQSSIGVHVQ